MARNYFKCPVTTNYPYPERNIDFKNDKPEDFGCFFEFRVKTELAEGFRHIEPKLEEEDALLRLNAKLYRFDKDGNQWKERGVGVLKLLKHKQTKKVRLVMIQSKTMKVIANHLVLPRILTLMHAKSENSWTWHASDFSDGELKQEVFCARFPCSEDARLFRKRFVKAAESQVQISEESKEGATSLAVNFYQENFSVCFYSSDEE
ncbi:hypothetical protein MKX03_030646 [Papaver bracteatum]|nr:hypothetical protein MKX03_030646 [Papaver bracteatum]